MRCTNCGHYNTCPRCNDYICEQCGGPLDEPNLNSKIEQREDKKGESDDDTNGVGKVL